MSCSAVHSITKVTPASVSKGSEPDDSSVLMKVMLPTSQSKGITTNPPPKRDARDDAHRHRAEEERCVLEILVAPGGARVVVYIARRRIDKPSVESKSGREELGRGHLRDREYALASPVGKRASLFANFVARSDLGTRRLRFAIGKTCSSTPREFAKFSQAVPEHSRKVSAPADQMAAGTVDSELVSAVSSLIDRESAGKILVVWLSCLNQCRNFQAFPPPRPAIFAGETNCRYWYGIQWVECRRRTHIYRSCLLPRPSIILERTESLILTRIVHTQDQIPYRET
jgi:hypothetical protein